MPINILLALYLVYPRYLFNMGPAYYEVWRASVDGESPAQHGDLLIQMHGWIEGTVGEIPLDAESITDGRRE